MGDRGNILIKSGNQEGIYFYTHWQGSYICEIVQTALRLKERWNDKPYLARIIFDKLTQGDRSTTGFGISNFICDNEHKIVQVDVEKQRVCIEDNTFTFKEFAKLVIDEEWKHKNFYK